MTLCRHSFTSASASSVIRKCRKLRDIRKATKTSVFCGDSPFLTALAVRKYQVESESKYRSNSYSIVNVPAELVDGGSISSARLFSMAELPMDRCPRLVLSNLPSLGGNFPLTSTMVLRLFNLLQGSNDSPVARDAIKSILRLPHTRSAGNKSRIISTSPSITSITRARSMQKATIRRRRTSILHGAKQPRPRCFAPPWCHPSDLRPEQFDQREARPHALVVPPLWSEVPPESVHFLTSALAQTSSWSTIKSDLVSQAPNLHCSAEILRLSTDSGGISTFSAKNAAWPANKTWVLKRATPLVAGLKAINDHGTHWLIAPAQTMSLDTYKSHLGTLNTKAVRYDQQRAAEAEESAVEVATPLAVQSAHADRATRFVYNALAAVIRPSIPVADWDENDYEYVGVLARAIEEGSLSLSALVWPPSDDGEGWSREKAFVARAISAYMAHEHAKVRAGGDEDAEADVANDHAYLRAVLKLGDAKNPCFAFDTSATGV